MAKPDATDVIFRKWNDGGDVIALFPAVPADNHGLLCNSFEHIGQHGGANVPIVIKQTTPATPAEYAPLKAELEAAPYNYVLRVVKRCTRKHIEARYD